ncbi:hypothetical protein GO496_02200 [Acidovorax citrulli]|nr:hypothetical protein [Paracidovorax citrulli]
MPVPTTACGSSGGDGPAPPWTWASWRSTRRAQPPRSLPPAEARMPVRAHRGSRTIRPMKTIRLRPGKERSPPAPPSLIFESAIAKGGGDGGRNRAGGVGGRPLPGLGRVQPGIAHPCPRLELRRGAAHRPRVLRRGRGARGPGTERFAIESDGVAWCMGGIRRPARPGRGPLRRHPGGAVHQRRHRALEGRPRRCPAEGHRPADSLRTFRRQRAPAGGPGARHGLAARRRPHGAVHPRTWLAPHPDIAEGHKTGFYLDQRDSRHRFSEAVRRLGARQVLNRYCYTGGFTVAALAGGASQVTSIDSSGPALERARSHAAPQRLRRRPHGVPRCRRERPPCGASCREAAASTPSCSIRRSSPPRPRMPTRAARA